MLYDGWFTVVVCCIKLVSKWINFLPHNNVGEKLAESEALRGGGMLEMARAWKMQSFELATKKL